MSFHKTQEYLKSKGIDVSNEEDLRHFNNFRNILISTTNSDSPDVLKRAMAYSKTIVPKNANDYYFICFCALADFNSAKIKKVAYPIMDNGLDIQEEYNLKKWSELVYKIYDSVSAGHMSFENALDYYSGFLDKKSEEDKKFKKWLDYYKKGEHLKYNKEEKDNIKKKADYQFALNNLGAYPSESKSTKDDEFSIERATGKRNYNEWKNKIYSAVRRIDKLLRSGEDYMDPETHRELAELLHGFDLEVRRVKLETIASDMAYNVADSFKKLGFQEGSDIMYSFAQENMPTDEVVEPEEIKPDDIEPSDKTEIPKKEEEGKDPEKKDLFKFDQKGNDETGPANGEYEALAGDVSIDMARSKLEDIAGRLADRRSIRLLAEFDIMLDKLGLASMFPELAESQSKLIDAYSYSLTRVTKMLGMLSSGRSLEQVSDAKKKEMSDKITKEVDKTFESENEGKTEVPGEEKTPIQKEFEPKEEQPKTEAPKQQAPPPSTPPKEV